MSVKKTKVEKVANVEPIENSESKDEKVARIGFKGTIISTVAVAVIGLFSLNLSEFIKKSAPALTPKIEVDETEIGYYENAIAESNGQYQTKENLLSELKGILVSEIQSAKNEKSKRNLEQVKDYFEDELSTLRESRKSFNEYSDQSIKALKNNQRETAAVLRRTANQQISRAEPSEKEIKIINSVIATNSNMPLYEMARLNTIKTIFGTSSKEYIYAVRYFKSKTLIRGINKLDSKKSMDEITRTYAKNEVKESVEVPKDLSIAAVAP